MPSGERARRDSGYVLFGVLIGAALLGVGALAATTAWSRVIQREREAELLFRGEAIVRALERYQQDRPGTLPETLDELVEGRYLRRVWRDPMTRAPFRILRTTAAVADEPPSAASAADLSARTVTSLTAGTIVESAREEEVEPGPGRSAAGIRGVASTSDELSFRRYGGAGRYSEWRFEVQVSAGARSASAGGATEGSEREER